jgi:hypothetical protein
MKILAERIDNLIYLFTVNFSKNRFLKESLHLDYEDKLWGGIT